MAAILVALNIADESKQEQIKAEEVINRQAAEIALLKKKLEELSKSGDEQRRVQTSARLQQNQSQYKK